MRKSIFAALFAALIFVSPLSASRVFSSASTHLDVTGSSVNVTGTQLTLAAWVMYTSLPNSSTYPGIITKNDPGGNKHQFSLQAQDSTGQFTMVTGNGGSTYGTSPICSTNPSTGVWYHVAATLSGTTQTVYLNGSYCNSNSSGTSMGSNGERLCIGEANNGGDNCTNATRYLQGRIAEAAVWNVALTANEIAALASGVTPPNAHGGTSLVGYWPLYGVDAPEPDLSGNGSSATVTGATAGNHIGGPGPGILQAAGDPFGDGNCRRTGGGWAIDDRYCLQFARPVGPGKSNEC